MCQCVAVSKSFWHSVYFLVWYPNRFTFLHKDSSKYYREELKRFATKTRDFRFGFVEFSKSLWLKIIQSICVQCTQTRIHILCGWCGCVMAYTFNLQFYENNCVLFSAFWLWIRKIFDTHTQRRISEARAWFRSAAAAAIITIIDVSSEFQELQMDVRKWETPTQFISHFISFHFILWWSVCLIRVK